jgi:hypothetical protein
MDIDRSSRAAPFRHGCPYPFYGGKKRVAPELWRRFGDPLYYIEPFAGSAATLLFRPSRPRSELLGGHLPSEADLYALHRHLLANGVSLTDMLRRDPKYHDRQMAAWFAWGQCLWIGTGWCFQRQGMRRQPDQRQHIDQPRGLLAQQPDKRQHIGRSRGLLTQGATAGPRQKLRVASDDCGGAHCQSPLAHTVGDYLDDFLTRLENHQPSAWLEGLQVYFRALQNRLERVDLCHGDWRRCVTKGVLNRGLKRKSYTAILFDPPYMPDTCESERIYTHCGDVAKEVEEWCREYGDRRWCLFPLPTSG